jgi:hypothetical protein
MQQLKKKIANYHVAALMMLLVSLSFAFIRPATVLSSEKTVAAAVTKVGSLVEEKMSLYDSLDLESKGLSREAFQYALTGYNNLLNSGKIINDDILSILDFSQSSGRKRLYIIDLTTGELLFHTYAAHGRGSGAAMATVFSNKPNSYKSSLGFYITGETYKGKHGESLRLNGTEKGFNDNAMARGIVIHSASYADEVIVERQGFIGRSQGCPALPQNISKEVITKIKNGTCLFLYSPDKSYTMNSKLLKSDNI